MDTSGEERNEITCTGPTGQVAAPVLAEFRTRARQLLRAQNDRVRDVERTLSDQLQSLFAQLAREGVAATDRERELLRRVEELERRRDELERIRSEIEPTLEKARNALTQSSQERRALKNELTRSQQILETQTAELETLRNRAADNENGDSAAARRQLDELARLQAERVELLAQLKEAERQQAQTEADPAIQQDLDDLRERFEMAVQEVRDLKAKNSELMDQQSDHHAPPAERAASNEQGFDWEAQKQALLAQLESDFDSADPQQIEEKLTVEGTIRITDQVVAEREKQIAELKKLLENQASNLGDVAVGAAAVANLLDHDELIVEERENLKRLQEDWREKLRQAEVEISVERAKIARERLSMEERIRSLEAERSQHAAPGGEQEQEESAKGRNGGRWRARLGLSDKD